ncbi:hypothetical protein QR685DRAFT_431799, partial [Neurospora intermedia]
KRVKEITKLEGISYILKRRYFACKNGIYSIKYYRLNCPTFLVKYVPINFACVSVN